MIKITTRGSGFYFNNKISYKDEPIFLNSNSTSLGITVNPSKRELVEESRKSREIRRRNLEKKRRAK